MNPTNQPSSLYNDPQLQQAQQNATNAANKYTQAASAQATLPDMLRDALNKKFTENNPLINDLNAARINYLNTSTSAPLSVLPENNNGMVFNPLQQADLINKQKTAALSPVMLLNQLLGIRMGGLDNTIDAAGRAYGGVVTGLKGAADTAQTAYSNLFSLIGAKQTQANDARDFAEKVREFNNPQPKDGAATDPISKLLEERLLRQLEGNPTPTRKVAHVQGESNAKSYAEQMEKSTGKDYGYYQGSNGWEIWEMAKEG